MIRYLYAAITAALISVSIRMLSASVSRAVAAAIAVAAAADFRSLQPAGGVRRAFESFGAVREKPHTVAHSAHCHRKRMSVFHCHLLNHEDKAMMAKILFHE